MYLGPKINKRAPHVLNVSVCVYVCTCTRTFEYRIVYMRSLNNE